jgi:serine/threonine protein kinase
MSTFISEPGTRLAGRYRLEDRVSETGGSTMWKAIDETLARPVAVLTFAPGFPRIHHVVTAARAASRMTDARLAQVFDVEDVGDRAYVVLEWVSGDSLEDLLAAGPLEPRRAAALVAEAAQALSAAHAAGLAHLCLTPHSLRWTPGGGVKITGLGVEAAMYGVHADDPAAADTQGLGRLLYAALTAHWPGDDIGYPPRPITGAAPPVPLSNGELRSPRQVCAGVPASIDAVTTMALSGRPWRGRPPLTSPAALADALAESTPLAPLTPPPVARLPAPTGPIDAPDGPAHTQAIRLGGGSATTAYPPPARDRAVLRKAVFGVIGLLAAVAIGVGAWTLSRNTGGSGKAGAAVPQNRPTSAVSVLAPVSAHGFDVYDTTGQDGNENDNEAPRAIDNNPQTAWHTLFYENNPRFGGLKRGTGLILDMGKPVKLSSVEVLFGPTSGADAQIEVGNNNALSPATLSSFTTVNSATDIPGGDYTFRATGPATGRYVLIWFTKLPPRPHSEHNFEAEIFNIVVRGSS